MLVASSLESPTQATTVAIFMTIIISTTMVIEILIKTLTSVEEKFVTMDPEQKSTYLHSTGTIRQVHMSVARMSGMTSAMMESALTAHYIADSIAAQVMSTTMRSATLTMQ